MKRYDVAVVGARVAGASTALLLARAGARVALIDRSPVGSDTVSTHALMRAGVLQLSRWGVLDAVVAAGTPPVRGAVFHYPGQDSVHVSIRPSVGVDALYAPRRHLLDRLLVEAAARAGADVLNEVAVTGLHRDRDGRVRGVRGVDRERRTVDLAADITVGADGVRSTVAEMAGAPVLRHGRTCSGVLFGYVDGLPGTHYEWAYGASAASGFIPTNDGQVCVFVSAPPEQVAALRREGALRAFTALLERSSPVLAERVANAERVGRLRGWRGIPGRVHRPWGRGWALVGDAGYFRDPITTHGMTDALRDAELLSTAIVTTFDAASEVPAMARYQATRDRLSEHLLLATEQVAAYDWDVDGIRSLLRRVSSAMSDEVDHLQELAVSPTWQGSVPVRTG